MKILTASLAPEQAYTLMAGIVVPRPIAWITSLSTDGVLNLAPFSFYTIVSDAPPMVGVNIGRRGDTRKDTSSNIRARREFVVNVADESLLEPLHQSATAYPPEESEVDILGLATAASDCIAVPRLADVPISLECRLHSVTPFGTAGSEFYVGEVLAMHIRDDLYRGGKIDAAQLRPICRLAGPNYAGLGQIITLKPVH